MFLDPRYARVRDSKSRLATVGAGVLSTTRPDTFSYGSDLASFETADGAHRVSFLRFRCKSRQIAPLSGK